MCARCWCKSLKTRKITKKNKQEALDNEQFKRTLNFKAGWKTAVTQAYLIFRFFQVCTFNPIFLFYFCIPNMTTSSTKTPAKGRQFIEPCVYTVPWKNKFLSDAIRLPLFHNEKVMPFHRSTHTHTFINMHMGEKTGFIPRFWIQKQNFFFFSQTFVTLRVRKQPPLNEPLSFS